MPLPTLESTRSRVSVTSSGSAALAREGTPVSRSAESTHAIRAAIDEALDAKAKGEKRVILFNLCGHGHFDMQAYDDYNNGRLPEVEFDPAEEEAALANLPEVSIQV